MRLTNEEIEKIKEENSVDTIWSFSRVNLYKSSHYAFYLKYIKGIKGDRHDSIYAVSGGFVHDLLEKLYKNEIKYEDMIKLYENQLIEFDMMNYKYNRSDEEANKKIQNKYESCIKHFLTHHKVFEQENEQEQYVTIKVGDELFGGYIDFLIKEEDGTYTIIDWKTSSMYKGEKVKKESAQLVLYSQGLYQRGIPLDKIRCGWDFCKYVNVSYMQKNGEMKERQIERNAIGKSLTSPAKTKLKAAGYSNEEISDFVMAMVETNGIDCLPEEIREQFDISDCIVYIPLSEAVFKELNDELIDLIKEIREKTEETEKTTDTNKIDVLWWDSFELIKEQEYYFANLSDYSRLLHKPYNAYLNTLEDESISGNIFVDAEDAYNAQAVEKTFDNMDFSWLDD